MNKKAVVIGSGFAGLSAATFMARDGYEVTLLEKHATPGGRARQLRESGFSFDMGPSWYWMPDIFERYFACFGKKVSDFYSLTRLDPSYRVVWSNGYTDMPADLNGLEQLFESWERGAAKQLNLFLKEAEYKYRTGMQKLAFKPGLSIREFADMDLLKGLLRMDIFSSMKKHIYKHFSSPRIRQLLEFPVLFLGALPENTPALYSLMNYADMIGGTWYPQGGMYSVVDGMYQLAKELGVRFRFNETVTRIGVENGLAKDVTTSISSYESDVVIGSADYHFIESRLLPREYRSYSDVYWNKRLMAPSCLLYYVGLSKKLKRVLHHNLFFDVPFDDHGREIYETKTWPSEPLFYVCVNSITDKDAAPEGCENLFFLIPIASGLEGDEESLRESYFNKILKRFEEHAGEAVREYIIYKKSFSSADFIKEYNSFKGNAYGLANTLMQTALLKPRCRSRKIKNLFYAGQLTVPGPGVPPSLISGEIAADAARSFLKNADYDLAHH